MSTARFEQITWADMDTLASAANLVTGLAGNYQFGPLYRWRGQYHAGTAYTDSNPDGKIDMVLVPTGGDAGTYAAKGATTGHAPTAGGNAYWTYLGTPDMGTATYDGYNSHSPSKKWLDELNRLRQDCWTMLTTATAGYPTTDLTKMIVSGPWPVPTTNISSDRLALTLGNSTFGGGFSEYQQIFTGLRLVTCKAGATLRVTCDNIASSGVLPLVRTHPTPKYRYTWVVRRKAGQAVHLHVEVGLAGGNPTTWAATFTASQAPDSISSGGLAVWDITDSSGALTFWVENTDDPSVQYLFSYAGSAWCEYSASVTASAISGVAAISVAQPSDDIFKVTANGSTLNLVDLAAYPYGLAGETRWCFFAMMFPIFKLSYNYRRLTLAPGQYDGSLWSVPQAAMVSVITQRGGSGETAIQTADSTKPRQPGPWSDGAGFVFIDCLWAVRAHRKADQHQPLLSKASTYRSYDPLTVQTGCFRTGVKTYFAAGEIDVPTDKFWKRVILTDAWPVFDNKPLLQDSETVAYVTAANIQLIDVLNTDGGGATPLKIAMVGVGGQYPCWAMRTFYEDTAELVAACLAL